MAEIVDEFMTAVKSNDRQKVSDFLEQDSNLVNAKDGNQSAILTAIYYGASDVIHLLLENGANLNVFEASAVGKTNLVLKHLHEHPSLVHEFAHDGFQALGLAAFFGHVETVKALLSAGAPVNTPSRNPMQVMPLHSSVAHRHLEISALLLEYGADVNAKQQDGFTPLLEAIENGQLEMAQLLISNGADVNLGKDDGTTPLMLASRAGLQEIVNLLKQNGATH